MAIDDNTLYGLTGSQVKELPEKVDGKISAVVKTNAGAPTTSTVGTKGQILEDTTNGKLYVCTDVDTVSDPAVYTWEEVGSNTLKVLTTADYDYDPNGGTPSAVAFWRLSPGLYQLDSSSLSAYAADDPYARISPNGNTTMTFQIGEPQSVTIDGVAKDCVPFTAWVYTAGEEGADYNNVAVGCFYTDGTGAQFGTIGIDVQDDLNGGTDSNLRALSARQGYLLNNKIEGRIKTNAGAPTTSTVGEVGQLLEDTTNGKLYLCTAKTAQGTTPETYTYTWEEINTDNSLYLARGSGNREYPIPAGSAEEKQMCTIINNYVSGRNKNFIISFAPDNKDITYTALVITSIIQSSDYARISFAVSPWGESTNGGSSYYGVLYHNSGSYFFTVYVSAQEYANANVTQVFSNMLLTDRNFNLTSQGGSSWTVDNISTGPLGTNNNQSYTPTQNYHPATKKYVDDKIQTSSTAPTTSTVGTVGQLLIDTTNGELYQCTAVDTTSTPAVYTWEEVGTDAFRVLTSADYNWNTTAGDATTTPFDAVAMWLMPAGHYQWNIQIDPVNVILDLNGTTAPNMGMEGSFIFTRGETQHFSIPEQQIEGNITPIIMYNTGQLYDEYATYSGRIEEMNGAIEAKIYLNGAKAINSVTYSQSDAPERALSAQMGKYLNDETKTMINRGAGAPTTSTPGSVGRIYEDTTNGEAYVCTAVSGNTYTWEKLTRASEIPTFTMTTTDPGEGQPLAANNFIAVYEA